MATTAQLKAKIRKRLSAYGKTRDPYLSSGEFRANVLKASLIRRRVYHCYACYEAGIKLPAPHVYPPPIQPPPQVLTAFEREAMLRWPTEESK